MRKHILHHCIAGSLLLGALVAQPPQIDGGATVVLIQNQGITRFLGRGLDGVEGTRRYRPESLSVPSNLAQFSAGDEHALYLLLSGTVLASGYNQRGQLGTGAVSTAPNAFQDVTTSAFILQNLVGVEAGRSVSYAWNNAGLVYGWGANYWGQMGVSPTVNNFLQPAIVPIPAIIVDVQSARFHTIALDSTGQVWQWGLLPWAPGVWTAPSLVPGLSNIQAIAVCPTHAVALTTAGAVSTWGLGAPFTDSNLPLGVAGNQTLTPIGGLPPITRIAAGPRYTLCLDSAGRVWSAGDSPRGFGIDEAVGALGPPSYATRIVPNLFNVIGIAAVGDSLPGNPNTGFAMTASGEVWAWGGPDPMTGLGLGNASIIQANPARIRIANVVPTISSAFSPFCTPNASRFIDLGLAFLGGELNVNHSMGTGSYLFAAPGPATDNPILSFGPSGNCVLGLDYQGLMNWISAGVVPIPSLPSGANAVSQYGRWRFNIPNDPALYGYMLTFQVAAPVAPGSPGVYISDAVTYRIR